MKKTEWKALTRKQKKSICVDMYESITMHPSKAQKELRSQKPEAKH
jgi:hypothetical protein